jgi:putative Mn2+ efflux pump MntP
VLHTDAIVYPGVVIGSVACTFTAAGLHLGKRLGAVFGKRMEVAGGLVLIGIGVKILVDHTGR